MSMTSTPFNVGLAGDGARNSSRVLRPPGGGHTDIFGGEAEPTRGRRQGYAQPPCSIGEQHQADGEQEPTRGRRQGYQQAANNFGQGDEPKPNNGIEPQNGNLTPEQPSVPEPAPEPVKPAASPVATPASPAKPEPAQPERAEPPKRVRVPPGGFSQGLW